MFWQIYMAMAGPPPSNKNLATALGLIQLYLFIILIDKSLAQSTISQSKPVSSLSKGNDDCDKKFKNLETIKSVHF